MSTLKRFLTLAVVSTLSACSGLQSELPALQSVAFNNPLSRLGAASVVRNADWFSALKPELQAYYAPARGKTGMELFKALNGIISQKNRIVSYGDSKSFMYAVADNFSLSGKTGLYDAYSYQFIPGSGGNGNSYKESGDNNQDGVANDFINCEHTWPQSFFNKQLPMVADGHHLFSTLSVPNNRRGHHPFGMVSPGSVVYQTNGGSKLGMTDKMGRKRSVEEMRKILSLPYEESSKIIDAQFDSIFEPGDRQKGNTARGMMYFFLRYYNGPIRSGEYDEVKFWDSKVKTFIQWSEQVDPVDQLEAKRHEAIANKQGNRNPFIDIPQLGSLIGEETLQSF